MKCPYLTGTYMSSCIANSEVYIPSSFELAEYCRSSGHRRCPFYVARKSDEYPAARNEKFFRLGGGAVVVKKA